MAPARLLDRGDQPIEFAPALRLQRNDHGTASGKVCACDILPTPAYGLAQVVSRRTEAGTAVTDQASIGPATTRRFVHIASSDHGRHGERQRAYENGSDLHVLPPGKLVSCSITINRCESVSRTAPARDENVILSTRYWAPLLHPVMGTGLTWGGGIAIVAVGPVFWFVMDLVWTALPA